MIKKPSKHIVVKLDDSEQVIKKKTTTPHAKTSDDKPVETQREKRAPKPTRRNVFF